MHLNNGIVLIDYIIMERERSLVKSLCSFFGGFILQVKLQGDKHSVKSLKLDIYQEGKKIKRKGKKSQTTSNLVNC